MSGEHRITCKKECYKCKYCDLYIESYKYPWLCIRLRNGVQPIILTTPYCGDVFTPPQSKNLISCNYYRRKL